MAAAMRASPLLVFLTACGAAPTPAPAAPVAPRCAYDGVLAYADLYGSSADHPIAHGHDLSGHVVLDEGPVLRATVQADGYELAGLLAPELEVVAPTRLGPVVGVNTGHRAAITGVDAAGVRLGLQRFALREITPTVPAEAVVRCDDLTLPGVEMTDPEADLRAFGLTPGEARSLAANVAIEVRPTPTGDVAATLAPDESPRRVVVLDERPGTVRIALHHWTDTFVVGWVDAASVVPLDEGTGGLASILGAFDDETRDLTVCRPVATTELSVRSIATLADDGSVVPHAPGAIERLGTVAAGTPLVLVEARADGLARIEPHPAASFHVPDEVEWLVAATSLGTCGPERYAPMPLADVLRAAE